MRPEAKFPFLDTAFSIGGVNPSPVGLVTQGATKAGGGVQQELGGAHVHRSPLTGAEAPSPKEAQEPRRASL